MWICSVMIGGHQNQVKKRSWIAAQENETVDE